MIIYQRTIKEDDYYKLWQSYFWEEITNARNLRNMKHQINVYCDASINREIIGVGVSIAGQGKAFFESACMNAIANQNNNTTDSTYAELLSIKYALILLVNKLENKSFSNENLKQVIIYNDCKSINKLLTKNSFKPKYREVAEQINQLLTQLILAFPTITFHLLHISQRKKGFYYKMADRLSKQAAKQNGSDVEHE